MPRIYPNDEISARPQPAKPLPPALIKTEVKGTHLLRPLAAAVDTLEIETEDDYAAADELLRGIVLARRQWKEDPGMYGTAAAPGAIPKIKEGLDALYDLNRRIDNPMAELEAKVRGAMRGYKIAEAQRIEANKVTVEAAREELTEKLRDTAEREQSAPTAKLRNRLASVREGLEGKLEELVEEAPVQAAGSGTRKVKKWRTNGPLPVWAICRAILEKRIPVDALIIDEAFITRMSREPGGWDTIASWPSFEVYEDIVIAARRR